MLLIWHDLNLVPKLLINLLIGQALILQVPQELILLQISAVHRLQLLDSIIGLLHLVLLKLTVLVHLLNQILTLLQLTIRFVVLPPVQHLLSILLSQLLVHL